MSDKPRLQPLFAPQSVAVLGASGRPGRPGHDIIAALELFGNPPRLYPVTPRYREISGTPCLADAAELPEPVDLAIIASGGSRTLPDALAALEVGAKALHVLGDLEVEACEELRLASARHGAAVLGPNSVGFINYAERAISSWIAPPAEQRQAGSIALIMQSGALFSYANAVDPRLRFSLTAQTGREVGVTLSDVLLYALASPETRVVGLYLETVADPQRFMEGLSKAERLSIPIVVLAPGRSQKAAEAIATHARRLAGSTAGLEAAFRRHSVILAPTLDQFWCTLRLLSAGLRPGAGGIGVITDSGAQRAMTIDAAERAKVPLCRFSEETEGTIRPLLAPGLLPLNPLDMWGGEEDLVAHTANCMTAVLEDPDCALGLVLTEFGVPATDIFPTRMAEGAIKAASSASKPIVAATFSTRHFAPARIAMLEQTGIIVLDGLETSLAALGDLFRLRDRRPWPRAEAMSESMRDRLRASLEHLHQADEDGALEFLGSAGIPVIERRIVNSEDEAIEAALAFGWPIVLKTAAQLLHKTEANGVKLDLRDEPSVCAAYRDLAGRLGPRVLVAPMVDKGIELSLGAVIDPVFGPLVMVGAGGTRAEILADRSFAMAPVSLAEALAMIGSLRLSVMLDPHRGKPGVDRQAIAETICAMSRLIAGFSESIAEIDVNPLIVSSDGIRAVDAVIVKQEPSYG